MTNNYRADTRAEKKNHKQGLLEGEKVLKSSWILSLVLKGKGEVGV